MSEETYGLELISGVQEQHLCGLHIYQGIITLYLYIYKYIESITIQSTSGYGILMPELKTGTHVMFHCQRIISKCLNKIFR